jgi:predicted PurR-regulated permease PerM
VEAHAPKTANTSVAVQQVNSPFRQNVATSNNASASRLFTLIAVVVVILGLYFGRQVLIPLALALVLAFLLTPVVDLLQKCRLGRVPAVLVVLLIAMALAGSAAWVATEQIIDIVDQYPRYKANIHDQIQSLRFSNGNRLKKATNTVTELSNELSAASEAAVDKKTGKKPDERPIPVQVAQPPSTAPQYLRAVVGPLTGVFETSAVVIVFTLFILVKREDLRNRLIRLAGQSQLNVVTQALDEASRRLNRYLLLQFLVNTSYGVIFGCASYWIGIPHAMLWGVLSGLLRFVPYVGTPIAAAFPIGMALAVFSGWHQAVLIFGVFALLELFIANVIEPWLYGAHTGISSLAILVAAVFWAILWGPVGLILSTPLTVCLTLLGRYIPQLGFLEVLLGDEAVLPVSAHLYQRLLALDQDEATDIAKTYLKEKPVEEFYDSVVLPALALAERDRHADASNAESASFVRQGIRELIEGLGGTATDESFLFSSDEVKWEVAPCAKVSGLRVLCIPAGSEADELVGMMVEQLMKQMGCEVRHLPLESHPTLMEAVASFQPQVIVVSALSPFAVRQARLMARKVHQRYPALKIVQGLWNIEAPARAVSADELSRVEGIATSLHAAVVLVAGTGGHDTAGSPEQTLDIFQPKIVATDG